MLEKIPFILRHLYTMLVVMFGWVFFRANSLETAFLYIKGMFVFSSEGMKVFRYSMNRQYWFLLIIGCILSIPHKKYAIIIKQHISERKFANLRDMLIMFIFVIAICYMTGTGFSPFLYFRF